MNAQTIASRPGTEAGFTRIELAALLGALLLLLCVAYPLLAVTRVDTARVLCLNNLRQIGQAYGGWKNEHNDAMPQHVDYNSGGVKNHPARQSTWFHYFVLSNHLATPQPLACPADRRVLVAEDWSDRPGRGLAGPIGLGERAISYFVGLHGLPEYPTEFIAGDYCLAGERTEGCGVAGVQAESMDVANAQIARTNYVHPAVGNLLFNDGRAVSATAAQLKAHAQTTGKYEADRIHLLNPNRPRR